MIVWREEKKEDEEELKNGSEFITDQPLFKKWSPSFGEKLKIVGHLHMDMLTPIFLTTLPTIILQGTFFFLNMFFPWR